jgi:glutamine amidotransferase
LQGPVKRLDAARVPHMGWNTLTPRRETALIANLAGADVYFAHSFAVHPIDENVVAAEVEHGGTVVAAVESGPVAGVQFHPERSGPAGARFLRDALAWSRSA